MFIILFFVFRRCGIGGQAGAGLTRLLARNSVKNQLPHKQVPTRLV